MRSITSFRLDKPAQSVDDVLKSFEWSIANSNELSSADWQAAVLQAAPAVVLDRQEGVLRNQHDITSQLEHLKDAHPDDGEAVLQAQRLAADAERKLLREEREFIARLEAEAAAGHPNGRHIVLDKFQEIGVKEARYIYDQIAEEDQPYAILTLRYPVFDRGTQTWGTVHYEEGHHRVMIRLRNPQPERLRQATKRLVEDLIAGDPRSGKYPRLSGVWYLLGHIGQSIWYAGTGQRRPRIVFEQIRVLESKSSREAFTGEVRTERSLQSVLVERRGDLKVAAFFLMLALTALVVSSPLVLNVDYLLHQNTVWKDGWLAWFAGNLSRLSSAFAVAVFLPIIQVWLHWRAVVRRPSISWSAD